MISVDAQTQFLGLLGSNLKGSPSCTLHNTLIEKDQLNWLYLPFQTQSLKTCLEGLKALPFIGGNVTYPYKEQIIPLLDDVDPLVKKVGAVNTILKKKNLWFGKNSDVGGFTNGYAHLEWNNKDVLILGAGGAARAVLAGIERLNCGSIYLFNRTYSRAVQLAKEFPITPLHSLKEWKHLENSIIVNTTSVGKNSDHTPWKDDRSFKINQIVIDIIYKQTPLLVKAIADGAKTINGLPMLVHQAAISYGWWTNNSKATSHFVDLLFKHFHFEQNHYECSRRI